MININTNELFIFILILNSFTVIFFLLYLQLYKNTRIFKLRLYILARLLQSITWLIYALNINQLDSMTMAFAMFPFAFGISFEAYCLVTANKEYNRKKLRQLMIPPLVYSIIYAAFAYNSMFRVIIASVFLGGIYTYIWVLMSLQRDNSKMEKVTGWLGFILSLFFWMKGSVTFLNEVHMEVTSQLYYNVLGGIGIFITAAVWPLLFLLLQKENDERIILAKEKKIIQDNQKLRQSNATKDKLFSIISHDLRSPFNAIIGLLELIYLDSKNKNFSKIERYSELAQQSAQQSYILMNNLLEWSKLQSGKIKLTYTSFLISDVIESVLGLLNGNIEKKKINLHVHVNNDLTMYADQFMIETVFRNLLSNAIKFSHPGGNIFLKINQNQQETQIQVIDEGVGIPPQNMNLLFDIEKNLSTNGTNREKGSGLGLILCKEFIKKHKGTINITSEEEKGTTVSFTIPFKRNKSSKNSNL